jgi:hypothetical protein
VSKVVRKLDMQKLTHHQASVTQLLDQLKHMSVSIGNVSREAREHSVNVARYLAEAELLPSWWADADMQSMANSKQLKAAARILMVATQGLEIESLEGLAYWADPSRKPGAKPPYLKVDMGFSGHEFDPKAGANPRRNGGAMTVFFRRFTMGRLWLNLGTLLLLARFGARVLLAGQPQESDPGALGWLEQEADPTSDDDGLQSHLFGQQ